MPPCRINVVGAGICGLSVAHTVMKMYGDDVEVTITSEKFYDKTTSYAAGGLWEPHLLGETDDDLVIRWSEDSFRHYQNMYFGPDAGAAGVQQIKVHNLFSGDDNDGQIAPLPVWASIQGLEFSCPGPQLMAALGFPAKYTHAHSFNSYVADPMLYLVYLTKALEAGGVKFEEKRVARIEDQLCERGASGQRLYDVVVNCTGLGAVDTEGDTDMFPIRGQVLRVRAPWIKTSCTFGNHYVIPNVDSLVIGGTAQRGDWSTEVSEEDSEKIMQGVLEMFPSLRHAEVLRTNVGLRPCRTRVRLDSELFPPVSPQHQQQQQQQQQQQCQQDGPGEGGRQLLVRCYGVGGSGFTIGPGVARDVAENHIGPYLRRLRDKSAELALERRQARL